MSIKRVLIVAVLMAVAGSAMAVPVEEYSWLQLSPQYGRSFVGNADGEWPGGGPGGHGNPRDIRFRSWVWVPTPGLTGAANGVNSGEGNMYWAALQLDQPRQIEKVDVQIWCGGNEASLSKFYVDVSLDGGQWTEAGFYDTSAWTFNSSQPFSTSIATVVLPENLVDEYQFVRVRFMPGDYATKSTNYGGPSVMMISPIGSGEIEAGKVNWANRQFGTTIAASVTSGSGDIRTTVNGVNWLIGGDLRDCRGYPSEDNYRAGTILNSSSSLWFELDLGKVCEIEEVVGVWASNFGGAGFTVQYSTNGTTFVIVEDMTKDTTLSNSMTRYTFDPIEARYWRITELSGGSGFMLFQQIMMYGQGPVPEPATMSLLALGGLALLRRRVGR